MRIPIAIAIITLAVGSLFGWDGAKRLGVLRNDRRQLVAEAESLGLPTETNGKASVPSRSHDRQDNKEERMIDPWTQMDPATAGQWIKESPAGPVRETAIHTHAETLAPHNPQSAAEWAVFLPDSSERTELLRDIHRRWKRTDETAATKFAKEHGLSE